MLGAGVLISWMPYHWPSFAIQAALIFYAAWRAFREKLHWSFSPWLAALLAGVTWPWVQIALGATIYAWQTHAARLSWMFWLAAYLLASSAVRRDERSRGWMLSATARFSVVLALIVALYRTVAGESGPWQLGDQYAGFVLLTLPVTIWHCRGWMIAGPLVQVASVLLAGSPVGAILAAAEACAVLLLRGFRKGVPLASTLRALAPFGVLVAVTLGFVPGPERPEPLRVHTNLTISTMKMAVDRPFFGWGLGAWPTAYPAYARFDDGFSDNYARNDWAQWLAEGGIVFFLGMLMLAGGAIGAGWRTGWGMGLAFLLVHCVIQYHFQERPILGAAFFTIAGLTRQHDNY